MTKEALLIGLLFFVVSCSEANVEEIYTENCSTLFEKTHSVGELRILLINQARLDEEIYVSNSGCNQFVDGSHLTANARNQLAELIGTDDEGGILGGVYVVDLNVDMPFETDDVRGEDAAPMERINAINSLVDEIGFDGLAAAFAD